MRTELTQTAAWLDGAYGRGKYCPGGDQTKCMGIDQIDQVMAKSRDPKEIEDLWVGWHKVAVPMRDKYSRFVELSNQGARELGYADTGVLWRSGYDEIAGSVLRLTSKDFGSRSSLCIWNSIPTCGIA